jgi:hypothetical protein
LTELWNVFDEARNIHAVVWMTEACCLYFLQSSIILNPKELPALQVYVNIDIWTKGALGRFKVQNGQFGVAAM